MFFVSCVSHAIQILWTQIRHDKMSGLIRVKLFGTYTWQRFYSISDHLCFLCLVFLMLSRLFIAALWLPAGKGLSSWLLLVMFIVFW